MFVVMLDCRNVDFICIFSNALLYFNKICMFEHSCPAGVSLQTAEHWAHVPHACVHVQTNIPIIIVHVFFCKNNKRRWNSGRKLKDYHGKIGNSLVYYRQVKCCNIYDYKFHMAFTFIFLLPYIDTNLNTFYSILVVFFSSI